MSKNRKFKKRFYLIIVILLVLVLLMFLKFFYSPINLEKIASPSWITQDFISVGGYSRSGKEITGVKNIVVHYVANPGSTAKNNRDYFESSQSEVSSHFVVGLEGEIIQCLPLNEQSAASNNRNPDTISIEVCHPDNTGEFSIPTYNATVELTAWLCKELNLSEEDVIRHYDITGKECPIYYVENEDAWEEFKGYIKERL